MKKRKTPKKRIAVIERRHYYADVTIDNVEYTKFMVHFVDDDDYYYMYKPKTHNPSSVPREGQTVSFTVHNETARNVRVIK
jgi:hypothetical protein